MTHSENHRIANVNEICATLRNTPLERSEIVTLINAIAGSVVLSWPRTSKGFVNPAASDILEWLDAASDAVADGVGLSDWVAK